MNLFIFGYLLPLLLSIGGMYFVMKKEGETVGEFMNMMLISFVPLVSICLLLLAIVAVIDEFTKIGDEWMKLDEKWEKFKKKKL